MDKYDVIVIGAGPAGFAAAVRSAQLGRRTACVDGWRNRNGEYVLGGACLQAGCIPSKAMLDSSEQYFDIQRRMAEYGIEIENVRLNLAGMIERKHRIVDDLTRDSAALFEKHGITWIKGIGSLRLNQQVAVREPVEGKDTVIEGTDIIIATGSTARDLSGIEADGDRIVLPGAALDFDEVPGRLGVIGAGAVGVEMGAVWNRLGSEVILLDAMEDFLFYVDHDVAQQALKIFTGQGLDIRLGIRVLSTQVKGQEVILQCQDKNGTSTLTFDKVVVAIGRKPRTDELNAEEIGLYIDVRGLLLVDAGCRTNLPHIYAVGDVVHGPMLAHKGAEEGVIAAERIAGGGTELHHDTIPWAIYTSPEIAWVGKTEKELKSASQPFRSGLFPLAASGRARAMNATDGLVKILADEATDEILGVHILAPNASEMIAEAVVAMEFAASAEDLARIVHAHPSISEAVHEAALDVDDRARQV